jgi:hypothetical protein
LSFACGSSYENVRQVVYQNYQKIFASHYSIRPAKLFPDVDQRITLFVGKNKGYFSRCNVYSSRLWRFTYGNEKEVVNAPQLGHVGAINSGIIPKTAGNIGAEIYKKISSAPDTLGSLISNTGKDQLSIILQHDIGLRLMTFCPTSSAKRRLRLQHQQN